MGLNVTVGDDLARYIQTKIEAGAFSSPSEVVENALRLLESLDPTDALMSNLGSEEIAWLRAAWEEGIQSGDAGPLDMEEIKREARRRLDPET